MATKKVLFPIWRESLILFLRRFTLFENLNIKHRKNKREIIPVQDMEKFLDVADKVLLYTPLNEIRIGLVKDTELDAEGHFARRAAWPKFERFLKNNNLNYSFYDIHTSRWQDEAGKYEVIIWHPRSTPDLLPEAKSKIYFLEKYLGKKCYPSFDELWSYEDKMHASYLYDHYGLPAVPTFSTYSKTDALNFTSQTAFPVISKIATGSASCGVIKLKNKRSAVRYINITFSKVGRKTYWPFARQINYVYFQKFINSSKFDLRVIVVGNKLFGYYRFPKDGDFRASGAGKVVKKELPEEAMRLAVKTKETFKAISLAVDMLFSEEEQKYYIIETSIFCGIGTAEQLVVDGIPGFYEYNNDKFTFKKGKFWIQELALQEFFNTL